MGAGVVNDRELTAIGKRIVAYCTAHEVELKGPGGFVERSGLSANTIRHLMYGSPHMPRDSTFEQVSKMLDVSVDILRQDYIAARKPNEAVVFRDWLMHLWRTQAIVLLVVCSAAALATIADLSAFHGLQAAIILGAWFLVPRPTTTEVDVPAIKIAQTDVAAFRLRWQLAWLCWAGLYVVMALTSGLTEAYAQPLRNLLQNGSTVCILLCWDVVAHPGMDGRKKLGTRIVLWCGAVLGALVIAEFLLDAPPDFTWFSGFAQGMALVLLVGRFGSHLITRGAIAIGFLLFYAIIQGAWPAFAAFPNLEAWFTRAALFLKCLLFLFVAWLLQSDVLVYYLVRSRELIERLETGDRWDFLAAFQRNDATALRKQLGRNTSHIA